MITTIVFTIIIIFTQGKSTIQNIFYPLEKSHFISHIFYWAMRKKVIVKYPYDIFYCSWCESRCTSIGGSPPSSMTVGSLKLTSFKVKCHNVLHWMRGRQEYSFFMFPPENKWVNNSHHWPFILNNKFYEELVLICGFFCAILQF